MDSVAKYRGWILDEMKAGIIYLLVRKTWQPCVFIWTSFPSVKFNNTPPPPPLHPTSPWFEFAEDLADWKLIQFKPTLNGGEGAISRVMKIYERKLFISKVCAEIEITSWKARAYGIFTRVGEVSEIERVSAANEWDFWYKTSECENPVQSAFHAVICLFYTYIFSSNSYNKFTDIFIKLFWQDFLDSSAFIFGVEKLSQQTYISSCLWKSVLVFLVFDKLVYRFV